MTRSEKKNDKRKEAIRNKAQTPARNQNRRGAELWVLMPTTNVKKITKTSQTKQNGRCSQTVLSISAEQKITQNEYNKNAEHTDIKQGNADAGQRQKTWPGPTE
jgi:hypothetical protein